MFKKEALLNAAYFLVIFLGPPLLLWTTLMTFTPEVIGILCVGLIGAMFLLASKWNSLRKGDLISLGPSQMVGYSKWCYLFGYLLIVVDVMWIIFVFNRS